jgi:hypothetical protein
VRRGYTTNTVVAEELLKNHVHWHDKDSECRRASQPEPLRNLKTTNRIERNGLEEPADNAKARDLFWKPLSWLGTTRPSSANDAFDPALWTTFVSTTLGVEVSVLISLPRLKNSQLAKCGCKKHCMDFHGDHTATCTAHSGATKAHDWMVSVLGPCFARLDTRFAHNTGSRPAQANGAATWRSATTYETKRAAGAWSSTSASP